MWTLILLGILALCAVAYLARVKLLAKALGQPERRIERHLRRGRKQQG